jgi:hypothetical protein
VTLHVYDVRGSATLNALCGGRAGAFHTGIELFGKEWSFGATRGAPRCGIFAVKPSKCAPHFHRETVELGFTQRTPLEVFQLLLRLAPLWCGSSYDVLRQNCNSFCLVLAGELGVDSIPPWTHALADGAARIDDRARRLKHDFASAGRRRLGVVEDAVDEGVATVDVVDVLVETRSAKAAIISDDAGVWTRRRFLTVSRAQAAWDALPLKDASPLKNAAVLFLRQDDEWRPLHAYGQSPATRRVWHVDS